MNKTKPVFILLGLSIIIDILSLGSDFYQSHLLRSILVKDYPENIIELANFSDQLQNIMGIAQFVVYIITVIIAGMWIYQAHRNLPLLGATGLKFTPASSVWWYFVPLANLIQPYRAMKEIWKASHNPKNWQMSSNSWLLPLWWCAWIIDNIVGNRVFRESFRLPDDPSISQLLNLNNTLMFSDLLGIISALLFILVIRRIHFAQQYSANHTIVQ
ncbi:hypothetical protein A4G19_00930 [Pasteurellaceae bacterium Macca]|nr:hypothetical protein [Pasteurellaceae bacterium Macca]